MTLDLGQLHSHEATTHRAEEAPDQTCDSETCFVHSDEEEPVLAAHSVQVLTEPSIPLVSMVPEADLYKGFFVASAPSLAPPFRTLVLRL